MNANTYTEEQLSDGVVIRDNGTGSVAVAFVAWIPHEEMAVVRKFADEFVGGRQDGLGLALNLLLAEGIRMYRRRLEEARERAEFLASFPDALAQAKIRAIEVPQ